MEVDKKVCFWELIILNSSFLSDFLWCRNDSDLSDFTSCGLWLIRLRIYFALVNPWADHLLQRNHFLASKKLWETMANLIVHTVLLHIWWMRKQTAYKMWSGSSHWYVFEDNHLKSKLWWGMNRLCNFLETEVSLNRWVRRKIYFAVSYSALPSNTMINGTGIIWSQLLLRPGYITRLIPYHKRVLSPVHFSHCISLPAGYKPGYVLGLV
jgi:hypothetical protein